MQSRSKNGRNVNRNEKEKGNLLIHIFVETEKSHEVTYDNKDHIFSQGLVTECVKIYRPLEINNYNKLIIKIMVHRLMIIINIL